VNEPRRFRSPDRIVGLLMMLFGVLQVNLVIQGTTQLGVVADTVLTGVAIVSGLHVFSGSMTLYDSDLEVGSYRRFGYQ